MLALLQQYGPTVGVALLSAAFAASYIPKEAFAKLVPTLGKSPDKAAGMILDAALLLAKAGRTAEAKEAFELGAKCSKSLQE